MEFKLIFARGNNNKIPLGHPVRVSKKIEGIDGIDYMKNKAKELDIKIETRHIDERFYQINKDITIYIKEDKAREMNCFNIKVVKTIPCKEKVLNKFVTENLCALKYPNGLIIKVDLEYNVDREGILAAWIKAGMPDKLDEPLEPIDL